jgi:hypothetical protein
MGALDTLKLIAAGLVTGYTDDQLNAFIAMAVPQLDPCIWGSLYTLGLANLTAHMINAFSVRAAAAGSGAAGPVTMEIAGRVTIQYAQPRDWQKDSLAMSPWGLEYKRLAGLLAGRHLFNTGFRTQDACDPDPTVFGEDNSY